MTFGSADSDAFTYDPNTGRMKTYTFSVNTKTDVGTLTWNANGTLNKLVINDQIPSTTDSQTCTYGYDDVRRISNVTCGTFWVQNFGYDAFGNITKNVPSGDGGLSFLPSYFTSPPTNQFSTLPGATPHYDAVGNLLTDNLNTYTWDAYGNMATVNTGSTTVTATYDASGRMVENNAGGSYTEFVYGPTGKLAKCNGQTLVRAFVALPGGAKAIYTSTGLAYYRHSDWLGSSRLTSTATPPTSMYSSSAYAPFGEQYKTAGSADASFTGQDQDTVSNLYDFPARRQSPSQGRWISPDPAGRASATLTNPQSWNRYVYALNNPLRLIDSMGLDVEDSCGDDEGGCDGGGGGGGGDGGGGVDGGGDSGGGGDGGGGVDGGGDNGGDPGPGCGSSNPFCYEDTGDPNNPDINKTQLLMDTLNPNCSAFFGGVSNAVQALAATTYVNVNMGNFGLSPNTPTDQNAVTAVGNALAFFELNTTSQAFTQSFNWDGPNGVPPSSTTFEVLTFLQPSFYALGSDNQQAVLLHELEHGVGYGAQIDGVDQNGNNINIQQVQQNCPEQQVPTETSQVDDSIS